MASQTWTIPLRDGRTLVHGRRPDPTSPSGKKYWYEIDGESGLDGMPKTEIPLYAWGRLKEDDAYVVITEGEKDADALLDRGVVAVGTATGASGEIIPCDDSLKAVLGRIVYLWADHDDPGTKHMDTIAAQLFKLGADDIRDVDWAEAPHKGGAADFTDDDQSLLALIDAASPREKPDGDLAVLLDDVCKFINKYVILTTRQTDAISLWVLHTWTFEAADTTPYLWISSPEKQSGKSRLLEVAEQLVRLPWKISQASTSSLFRKIEQETPTLLFDEGDAMFKGKKEFDDDLRGLLNAGHRSGGAIARTVGQGSNYKSVDFSVFCPKAIAGIGDFLPDTVVDRSIPIAMNRKASREEVSSFRFRHVTKESVQLRNRLETWAEYNIQEVARGIEADPELPDTLSDRAKDGWEPLVAIADIASSEWSKRARQAATVLMNVGDDGSTGVTLLVDIASVFRARNNRSNIGSVELIQDLCAMDEAPWGDWHGRTITSRGLSQLLKPYGIKSRSVRIGNQTPKGYRREDFVDAWSRYTPDLNATAQHLGSEPESGGGELFETSDVADSTSPEMPLFELNVADVAHTALNTGREAVSQEFVDPSGESITKIKL
jgi:hypothetical protein